MHHSLHSIAILQNNNNNNNNNNVPGTSMIVLHQLRIQDKNNSTLKQVYKGVD